MRKLFLIAVVATALLIDNGVVQAGRHGGGCGGGCGSSCGRTRHFGGHRHHGGGCSTCAAPAPCGGCGAPTGCCDAGGCGPAYAMIDGTGPATMVVELPEDAILSIDGVQTTSTSSTRVLVTPALEGGRTFQYTLTAQVMRDGVQRTVSQQVNVQAGQETLVTMELPVAVASR